MCLVISILYIFLYGRVGGVSRGGCAYPDIQITGRLYHFFWKLPNFSFRQFFWNSCYNLYLHQYQNPTKYQKWRGLLKTFGVFKHCVATLWPCNLNILQKHSLIIHTQELQVCFDWRAEQKIRAPSNRCYNCIALDLIYVRKIQ